MKIRLLPCSTINRIAAGEVIERPASVIKELVENSIDAGATKIEIFIEQAGKNLILVVDNGCGMSRDDLELAILKNTTSKLLDDDDLSNINSFGFRGEALSSIAEISRLSITSRAIGSDRAYSLQIMGGRNVSVSPAVFSQGTKFEIRDLFFATPARLKFLRSDKTEYLACVNTVKKIALAYPFVNFKLFSENKEILNYSAYDPNTDSNNSCLNARIAEIMGKEFAENSVAINHHLEDITLTGLVSLPTFNRATSEDQFLFINNRPIKDKILISSLRVAYLDYIVSNRYPLAVIFLSVPPNLVDVNVHPAKAEVRFHDPSLVRRALISAVKAGIHETGGQVSNTHANNFLGSLHRKSNSLDSRYLNQLSVSNEHLLQEGNYQKIDRKNDQKNNFSQPAPLPTNPRQLSSTSSSPSSLMSKHFEQTYRPLPESIFSTPPAPPRFIDDHSKNEQSKDDYSSYPLGAAKAQFHKTYILSQTQGSIIITDQHAAHERLGYEQIKATLAASGLLTQRLLFPEVVELSEELTEYMANYKANLQRLGLVFEIFGTTGISVSEIPSLLRDANVGQLIRDIADHLKDCGEDLALTKLIEHVVETYACHYSVRAGRTLSIDEMNSLLRQMEEVPFSGQCNHGRPTYIELDLKSIEKLFGRR